MFNFSRRQFVQGLAAGGVLAGLSGWSKGVLAAEAGAYWRGRDFVLQIGELPVNFTGKVRSAITVNQSLPAPTLRWRQGDTVTVRVENRLPAESLYGDTTSIHWHGIVLPANMDGVPGMSFDGITRNEAWLYRFTLKQSGTYWYHSHSGFQEQAGLYGALIIDALEPEPFEYDREHVLLLSDWTDLSPRDLFLRLKKMSSYDNHSKRTVADFIRDVDKNGLAATLDDRKDWGRMRMTPTDLSDVNANTYTYLVNGQTALANWTGLFKPGEKLRLRLINGSAMTYFDIRIPGLKMTVVAADGQNVHPVTVDELRIAVAETYDVIVQPQGQEAYTIFAQDMGRTGYVSASLAVRQGLRAPVPALDPRPILSMADMGHGAMDHGKMDHASMGHDGHNMAAMLAHPRSEDNNPLVDMQTMSPTPKLDDPGIGLRDNGRRVLVYADLRSVFDDPDGRDPSREIELHLTGHMEKFAWSFNGIPFASAEPLRLNYGERVRIRLVNDTMMTHPIHLHGLWSDLEDAQSQFAVRKHTIDMPPGTVRSYRVSADALGRWAYHCHMLYHMESGMMREVRVQA
jgi:CopA family copper-resistance protein